MFQKLGLGFGRVQVAAQRQGAVGAHDERPGAADFAVQPSGQHASLRGFRNRRQVGQQCGIGDIGRRNLAVPARQRIARLDQGVGDFRVFDRPDQQGAQGHEKGNRQKNQQGKGQCNGAQLLAAFHPAQLCGQRRAGGIGYQWHQGKGGRSRCVHCTCP